MILCGALCLSLCSGYQSAPVPQEIKWQISPLGLLLNFNPILGKLAAPSTFKCSWGWNLAYFGVFVETCILEAFFYWMAFRNGFSFRGIALSLLALNFLTHPIVFFVFPSLFGNYLNSLLGAETFAAAVEGICALLLMRGKLPWGPSLVSASWVVLANLFSWQIGAMLL